MTENSVGKSIGERMAVTETVLEDHKDEINRLKDDNRLLHELVANNRSLADLVEQSHIVHKETSDTLSKINVNITELNLGQRQMKEELGMVKNEISTTNSRISEVEKKHETIDNRGKFDVVEFLSKDVVKIILVAIVVALLALIGLQA